MVLHLPDDLAGLLIERDQSPIQQTRVDFSVVKSDAAVHRSATDFEDVLPRNFRIPAPLEFPGSRVHREHHVPCKACRRGRRSKSGASLPGAPPSRAIRLPGPAQPQPLDVAGIDLFERTVVRLGVIAAIGQPLISIFCGILESFSSTRFGCWPMAANALKTVTNSILRRIIFTFRLSKTPAARCLALHPS